MLLKPSQLIPKGQSVTKRFGFSTVEVLLAAAIFSLVVISLVVGFIYGQEATSLAGDRARANMLAEEGLEAVRNIRDANFANLSDGTYYLSTSSNEWNLTSTPDSLGMFTRQISIGTIDVNRKIVTSTVSWIQNNQRRTSISLVTYLDNWQIAAAASGRGGMLVYSTGGATSDTISYQTLNSSGVWSTASSTADVANGSNQVVRAIRVYSSPTRNEKIAVSRHFNGNNTQNIYAQVYNGTSSTWANIKALSTWNNGTFLDVQNFDGTYLANGDFMVVYSDNSTLPKYRIWNGTTWSAENNMLDLNNTGSSLPPTFIEAAQRPGTNEVMVAIFDQSSHTNTEYFNGGTYAPANWSFPVGNQPHSAAAPTNTKRFVDFTWSQDDPTKGALVVPGGATVQVGIKIFTANGSGGGYWSSLISTPSQPSDIGALGVASNPKAPEFIFCDKDTNATPRIYCYKSTFTPTVSMPTNNILTSASGSSVSVARAFSLAYEYSNGAQAIAVYPDLSSTTAASLKKYNVSTATWDNSATLISGIGSALETSRAIYDSNSNDVMILLANTNQQLFSAVWDGTNNLIYASPAGKALTSHAGSGAADPEYWYDFTWN